MATVAQTITSDTEVKVAGVTQTISADTSLKKTGVVQALGSETTIFIRPTQTITSDTLIVISEADLKLFREADVTAEVGIAANPLDFGTIEAGEAILHPNNPFVLFNDKGGTLKSVDARDVTVSIQRLDIVDELAGFSAGTASQALTVAFPPVVDDDALITVKVNDVLWARVTSLAGFGPTDRVYVFSATTGTVQFGNGLQGQIPPTGHSIKVSYTPDTVLFGREVAEQLWVGVQSNGVISNPVSVPLEQDTPTDIQHVGLRHKPVVSVNGVFLLSDPKKLGTNFFTGGTFNSVTGGITLGTPLPDTSDVWVDYVYTIADDLEGGFTQIGRTVTHTFASPIPSNNAKRLNFRVSVPATASPSGMGSIRFKLRFEYTE